MSESSVYTRGRGRRRREEGRRSFTFDLLWRHPLKGEGEQGGWRWRSVSAGPLAETYILTSMPSRSSFELYACRLHLRCPSRHPRPDRASACSSSILQPSLPSSSTVLLLLRGKRCPLLHPDWVQRRILLMLVGWTSSQRRRRICTP